VVNSSREPLNLQARAVEALGKVAGVRANVEKLGQATLNSIHQSLVNQMSSGGSKQMADEPLLQSLTITALMRLQNPASVEPLSRQLKSNDADIRALAANALARLRQPINGAVGPLIEALQGPEVSVADRLSDDPGGQRFEGRADARANAARALGVAKDPRAVEPLLKTLQDPSGRAQVNAVRALTAIGDRRAVEPLIELAKRSDPKAMPHRQRPPSFNLLLECVAALGSFKDERALPLLGELSIE